MYQRKEEVADICQITRAKSLWEGRRYGESISTSRMEPPSGEKEPADK